MLGYVGNNPAREEVRNACMTGALSVSFEPKNKKELRQFFEAEKNKHHEIWVVITKKAYSNPQPISFTEAVSEAIQQGLIDSRTKTLSADKYAIRFTKRKAKQPTR